MVKSKKSLLLSVLKTRESLSHLVIQQPHITLIHQNTNKEEQYVEDDYYENNDNAYNNDTDDNDDNSDNDDNNENDVL